MTYEVFLSYTSIKEGPESLVTQLHGRLEQKLKENTRLTTKIFLDSEDIPPGAPWPAELEKALKEAKIFCFLLSPTWVESENCVKEYRYFVESMRSNPNKKLFPVLWTQVREEFLTQSEKKIYEEVSKYQRGGQSFHWKPFGSLNPKSVEAKQAILQLADAIADELKSLVAPQS